MYVRNTNPTPKPSPVTDNNRWSLLEEKLKLTTRPWGESIFRGFLPLPNPQNDLWAFATHQKPNPPPHPLEDFRENFRDKVRLFPGFLTTIFAAIKMIKITRKFQKKKFFFYVEPNSNAEMTNKNKSAEISHKKNFSPGGIEPPSLPSLPSYTIAHSATWRFSRDFQFKIHMFLMVIRHTQEPALQFPYVRKFFWMQRIGNFPDF